MAEIKSIDNNNISNFKVNFKLSDESVFRTEVLFGEVDNYFDNKMDTIEVKNYLINDLDFGPTSFYTLPNGNLVIASRKSKVLKIYDSEFKLIKTVDKINNKTFKPQYLTSNGKNSIYITDGLNIHIIQTDLDFNFIKQFGSKCSSNQKR